MQTKIKKLINIALTISTVIFIHESYADPSSQNTSIEKSSVSWEDESARNALLNEVPLWSADKIKLMFDIYKHQATNGLPKVNDAYAYNVLFINSFWGPVDNPFVKFHRPAKIFVFTNQPGQTQKYVMAPVVENENDKNYYVFDQTKAEPVMLQDWVKDMPNMRFNICTAYADLPTDSCAETSYQKEISSRDQDSLRSFANKKIPSAHRNINEDWHTKLKTIQGFSVKSDQQEGIYESAVAWNGSKRKILLDTVVAWPNYQTIKENFEKIRDLRYFQDESKPGFLRRLTWLYPDDGCWTRAAGVIKDFFGPMNNVVNPYPRPSKLFAFGNLCVNTTNSPDGQVSWWYHTAPIVRDAETNQTYVLDPSVNPDAPATIEQWMMDVASNTGNCAQHDSKVETFNICNGYGVSPGDSCNKNVDLNTEIAAMLDQTHFRYYERSRQEQLGRDANQVLGELPPWKKG